LFPHHLSSATSAPIIGSNRTAQGQNAHLAASYPFSAPRRFCRRYIANEPCPRALHESLHRGFASAAMISDRVDRHAATMFEQAKAFGPANGLRDGLIDQFNIRLIESACLSLCSRIETSLCSAASRLPAWRIDQFAHVPQQSWRDI
jgi:hypothetical protein